MKKTPATNPQSIRFLALAILLIGRVQAHAAAPLFRIAMTSGSASERDGVIYVAQDLGLFRKYGLDLTFVQVRNGPVAMSALSSGETQFHWGSVSGANLGAIAEGADLVFAAGFINRLLGAGNEKIRRLKAEDLVDESAVKKLENEGRF